MGTGAVGGYFGARLAAASHQVAFIARGAHLTAMQQQGLIVESPRGDLCIGEGVFTDKPAQVGIVDLVLFCVKSYDTETAAASLEPMIGDRTVILSLQNGVDNPDKIARRWGQCRTLAGVVYIGSELPQPGKIKHSSGGKIVLGELDGQVNQTTRAVERTLAAAEIPCAISKNIRSIQWRKLLWNAPFCAISCLTGAGVKEIAGSDALTKLALDCMAEVREAAKTQAIDLDTALFHETLDFSKGLGDFKPSMLQDLAAGKPLEVEAFNGIVVELLRQAGKEAPTNQVFYSILKHLDNKLRMERSRTSA
jgi:2-dehydropantoate 2-reductase